MPLVLLAATRASWPHLSFPPPFSATAMRDSTAWSNQHMAPQMLGLPHAIVSPMLLSSSSQAMTVAFPQPSFLFPQAKQVVLLHHCRPTELATDHRLHRISSKTRPPPNGCTRAPRSFSTAPRHRIPHPLARILLFPATDVVCHCRNFFDERHPPATLLQFRHASHVLLFPGAVGASGPGVDHRDPLCHRHPPLPM
jgi:hypothetical protein